MERTGPAGRAGLRPGDVVLAVNGDNLYVGGAFTSIDGANVARLAEVSIGTSAVDSSFDPDPGAQVKALEVTSDGSKIFAVGPFTAFPPMIGDTATTGAVRAANASRTPGNARIGSTEMNGLDGQITIARNRGLPKASNSAGCARAPSAPANRNPRTTGRHCRPTK